VENQTNKIRQTNLLAMKINLIRSRKQQPITQMRIQTLKQFHCFLETINRSALLLNKFYKYYLTLIYQDKNMPIINPLTTGGAISTNGGVTKPEASTLGKDDFMKILVAQLQAQDPLAPMEGQEFASQLAQFSSLEQLTNVNSNLEASQAFDLALSNSSALALIGKNVDAPGNTIDLKDGEVKTLSFSLDGDSAEVGIDIFNSTGAKVSTVNLGAQKSGLREYVWSGTDSSGALLPAGNYTFNITASNSANNFVPAKTFAAGLVTDVVFEDGKAFAMVNGQKLAVNEVSKVSL
jgi:flagellar basal-body rod modification protein FlgD